MALKISDINFESREININKSAKHISVVKENDTRAYYKDSSGTKSKSSIRTVPFPESMEPYLSTHIKAEKVKHLRFGFTYTSDSHKRNMFTNQ